MGLTAHRGPVEIVGPSPSWPSEFRAIGEELRALLGADALRIDHIGSTSIAGLAANDVIDVQITVAALQPWDAVPDRLRAAGYAENTDVTGDHLPHQTPGGEKGVDADWAKRLFREPRGRRHAHVHVRAAGRPNQRYALLFRDFLRAHADAAAAYEAVKRSLASRFRDDRAAYADVKDPVCDLILVWAERWASASGWQPGPSDA